MLVNSHDTAVAFDGKAAASNLLGSMATRATQPSVPKPTPTPVPVVAEKAYNSGVEKKREGPYKFSATEIEALDQKAENMQPLQRHWANVTFYILASLSIVLPLLFLCWYHLHLANTGNITNVVVNLYSISNRHLSNEKQTGQLQLGKNGPSH
jgi:hypothetical protein